VPGILGVPCDARSHTIIIAVLGGGAGGRHRGGAVEPSRFGVPFAKKIAFHGQLTDLRVQLGELRLVRRASSGRRAVTAREQRGDPVEQRLLPRVDLAGVPRRLDRNRGPLRETPASCTFPVPHEGGIVDTYSILQII